MTVRSRTNGGKVLRLAYRKTDGVRGKKLELEQIFSKPGVDIFLLNKTHLGSGRDLRFANYVFHRTDSLIRVGGTVILVHRSLCCTSLGSAAPGGYCRAPSVATRPVKLVATYLSPTRHLIKADLTECLSRGFPVLMAGDLNAKHTDWSSGLTTANGFAPA
jgi:hypothetical protein